VAKVQQLAKKEAAGNFSHRTDKSGVVHNAPQPTLPQISLDDDDTTLAAPKSTKYSGSVRTESYWSTDHKDDQSVIYGGGPDYPPMPAYDPNAYPPQPGYTAGYASSHGHDTGHNEVSMHFPLPVLLLTLSHQQHSNLGYLNDQYNYGANGYGQTDTVNTKTHMPMVPTTSKGMVTRQHTKTSRSTSSGRLRVTCCREMNDNKIAGMALVAIIRVVTPYRAFRVLLCVVVRIVLSCLHSHLAPSLSNRSTMYCSSRPANQGHFHTYHTVLSTTVMVPWLETP
jgi:hypothetical protein